MRLPRPVWSIIASMLSLDDRRKLMETSRDCCAGVLAYQADCCRKYLSNRKFNFYQQPGKATADPSDVGLYANGLIRHKFEMVDVHGMRDVVCVMSMLFTAFWDSLKSTCTNVTEQTHKLVSMMRVALGTFSSRARGKVVGEFLRADIFVLRRGKLGAAGVQDPDGILSTSGAFIPRKIRIFSIVHMVLGTVSLSHLLPEEGPYASFFSMMDYRNFNDGFAGFLTALKQIDAAALIPLFELNLIWYNFRLDRADSSVPVQLQGFCTSHNADIKRSATSVQQRILRLGENFEGKCRKKLSPDDEKLLVLKIYDSESFYRVPFTTKKAEELFRAIRGDILEEYSPYVLYGGPSQVFNDNITALSKLLAIIYRESHLSQKDFIHLVSDCVLDWSSIFVLMLLASLMEECPETEFLLRSQISRKFTPYSRLSDVNAPYGERCNGVIAAAYLYTISQRHFLKISKATAIRLFSVLEKNCWTQVQRKRLIQHMKNIKWREWGAGLLSLNDCPYGCCKGGYNPNVLAFMKHIAAKVPKLKMTRWTWKTADDIDVDSDSVTLSGVLD